MVIRNGFKMFPLLSSPKSDDVVDSLPQNTNIDIEAKEL